MRQRRRRRRPSRPSEKPSGSAAKKGAAKPPAGLVSVPRITADPAVDLGGVEPAGELGAHRAGRRPRRSSGARGAIQRKKNSLVLRRQPAARARHLRVLRAAPRRAGRRRRWRPRSGLQGRRAAGPRAARTMTNTFSKPPKVRRKTR